METKQIQIAPPNIKTAELHQGDRRWWCKFAPAITQMPEAGSWNVNKGKKRGFDHVQCAPRRLKAGTASRRAPSVAP